MNPPFTSRDNLPPEYRKSLDNKFASGKYVDCLTGKLSLQAYFLMLGDKIVKENGRIASVLPITTFSGKAFNQLDEFLLKNFSVKYIVVGTGRSAFSENTSLREILFIAEKSKPSENSKFALIGTKKSPTEWTDEITHSISKSASDCLRSETNMDDALCSIRILPQRELSQSNSGIIKLTWLLTPGVKKISHIIEKLINNSKRILTLHEFEKKGVNVFEFKMRTGSEFGYTALSIVSSKDRTEKNWDRLYQIEVMSDSVIIKDRITNKKFKIPKAYTHYSIRRLSGINTIEFKDRDLVITRSEEHTSELQSLS
jgi:hypothetical protein